MNASGKGERARRRNQTRVKLQQKTNADHHPRKTQVAARPQELQPTQTEMTAMEEIVVKLNSSEAGIKQAVANLQDMAEPLKQLQMENEALKRFDQKIQEEKETLRKRIEAAEERISRQAEATEKKQREVERQQYDLENRIRELEKRIPALEEKMAGSMGQPQRIIEHQVTEDKKSVEVSPLAMNKSIPPSLPETRESAEKFKSNFVPPSSLPPAPVSPAGMPKLRKLELVTVGTNGHRGARRDQPFGIRLILDLAELKLPTTGQLGYKAIISAKSLNGGPPAIVAEARNKIAPAKIVALDAIAKALSAGMYRLQAAMTLEPTDGKSAPSAVSLDGGIIHVY
jgi:predicted  nucleic acid-binding Zn-ribbon protein